jgi:hypothetical protein
VIQEQSTDRAQRREISVGRSGPPRASLERPATGRDRPGLSARLVWIGGSHDPSIDANNRGRPDADQKRSGHYFGNAVARKNRLDRPGGVRGEGQQPPVAPHEVQQRGLDHAPIVGAAAATGSRHIAADRPVGRVPASWPPYRPPPPPIDRGTRPTRGFRRRTACSWTLRTGTA